jgi:hypothetical protein
MSIITKIDKTTQLTSHKVSGAATVETLLNVLKPFWENRPTLNELWDFREASAAALDYDKANDIFELIKKHAQKRSGGKTAFISSADLKDSMANVVREILISENVPFQVAVFQTVEAALQWIDEKNRIE